MNFLEKIFPWVVVALIVFLLFEIYQLKNDGDIKAAANRDAALQNQMDSISKKQKLIEKTAKEQAALFAQKGNEIIKSITHEKKYVVLPAADSIDMYITAYKFTEQE